MNEKQMLKRWSLLALTIGIAALLLASVALADGGQPPPWWDNPDGYSSWRQAIKNSGPAWVDVTNQSTTLVVTLTVPNAANSNAHKEVWMQVEWDAAASDNITTTATMAWSYVGCEDGPWEPAVTMDYVDAYTPTQPTTYSHGVEYGKPIDPQPACELITVTFHDMNNDGHLTIRYNIEVQTLCFNNATAAGVVDAFGSPLAALPLVGLSLGGLAWRKLKRRR